MSMVSQEQAVTDLIIVEDDLAGLMGGYRPRRYDRGETLQSAVAKRGDQAATTVMTTASGGWGGKWAIQIHNYHKTSSRKSITWSAVLSAPLVL